MRLLLKIIKKNSRKDAKLQRRKVLIFKILFLCIFNWYNTLLYSVQQTQEHKKSVPSNSKKNNYTTNHNYFNLSDFFNLKGLGMTIVLWCSNQTN